MDFGAIFEETQKNFQKILTGFTTFCVILYSIYQFLNDKFKIDIFKYFKKKETKITVTSNTDVVKNVQDILSNKFKLHESEINALLHDLLLVLNANRVYLTEIINDYNLPDVDYKLMKMSIIFEHCNNIESDKNNWQNIPIGYMGDVADELFNKQFGIIYREPLLYKETPYRLVSANSFLLNDLERQGCQIMCVIMLNYGVDPCAILGVDYSRTVTVEEIEKTKSKMEDTIFIIGKERYGQDHSKTIH